ncbi:unnamed protein product [Phytophthora lilii]|uniref:Unnamed protein product n=1 Tax=Phytophthora lilii TaxID=2077276 RepID=A0A9W6WNR5_9STRA|nr:unnamed protein product [Phytophthora lilii]
MASFRQARGSKVISVVEEDSALVKVFEDQAVVERWPCLGTTTVCFLALLFQEDYQVGVALPGMSDRIVDAKKFIGTTVPKSSWNEASQNAVQRRVYDVVSVLVSCNLILTSATPTLSLESSLDIADKNYQRKHVRFNYDIFTNPRSLFATCDDEIPPWNFKTSPNVLFCNRRETFCECQSPIVKSIQDRLATPPWQIVHTGMAHNSSFFSPGAVQVTDTRRREKTNGIPSPFGGYERVATKCFAFSNSLLRSSAKCPQSVQQASRAHEFFSPIGREPLETNEWCDESLKQLGLFEALPTEDKIDWKLNEQFKDNYRELWGSPAALHPPVQNPAQQFWVDTVEVKVADIECHDVLNDNTTTPISNFFI